MISTFEPFKSIQGIIRHHHAKYTDYYDCVSLSSYVLHLADRIEILLNFDTLRVELNTKNMESLVYTLSKLIVLKSNFTLAHSTRVAHVAYASAQQKGWSESHCFQVKMAGYLHDIGKLVVPTEIIDKPSSLTKDEYALMKAHPYYTYTILKNIKGFERIALWAGANHEKIDGTGYPNHISQAAIDSESEIIACADVFSALSEERPYRKTLAYSQVLQMMTNQLDKGLSKSSLDLISSLGPCIYDEITQMKTDVSQAFLREIKGTNAMVDFISC